MDVFVTAIDDARLSRLDRSGRASWLWAPGQARIVWANAAAARLWRLDSATALIDRPFGAMDPARADMTGAADTLLSGGRIETHIRFWSASGRQAVPVLARPWALPQGGGGVLFQADPPAAQAAARARPAGDATPDPLDMLLGQMPFALALFSPRGPCLYANAAYDAITGLKAGPSLTELTGSTRAAGRFVHAVLAGHTLRTSPTLTVGGKPMSFDLDAARVVDLRTGRDAVLVQLQNTTARRNQEVRLIESAREIQALLEGVVEGWVVLDGKHRLLSFGGKSLMPFRAKLDAAIGRSWETVRTLLKLTTDKKAEARRRTLSDATGERYLRFRGFGRDELWRAVIRRRPESETRPAGNGGFHILFQAAAETAPARSAAPKAEAAGTGHYQLAAPDLWRLAGEALIAHDNFEIVFANMAAARLFGHLSPKTLVGRRFLDLFPDDEARAARHLDAPGLAREGVTESRLSARRNGGGALTVDAAFRLTRLDGRPVVLAACSDAGDRPAFAEADGAAAPAEPAPAPSASTSPAAAADPLETARWFDDMPVALIAIDAGGGIYRANETARRLLGVTTEDLSGTPFISRVAEDDRAAVEIRLAAAQRAPKSRGPIRFETALTASDGAARPVILTLHTGALEGTPVTLAALIEPPARGTGPALGATRTGTPPPTQRESELLASVSHEMRTPLNAIIGFAEFIKEGRLGPIGNERYAAYIDDIHMSGQHLLSLVNDLLDMSKIEAGQFTLDLEEIDPGDVATEAVRMIRPLADQKGVTLIEDLPPGLPFILADRRSLRQILLNLTSNAVKFTEAGGSVTVSAAQAASGPLSLSVEDTGIGMTADEVEEALLPFRQVRHKGRTPSGTGLGLPLAKALTEANHAQFAITSTPAKGTRIVLTFPAEQVKNKAGAAT